MTTRVKICGLTRAQDVETAIAEGAAYLGFIVEASSKRRLSVAQAAKISLPAQGVVPRVAVTVNAGDDLLRRIMAQMSPDFIQCHGEEDPARVAEIARKHSVGTIKALGIASASDMKTAEEYVGAADFVLYDAKPPQGSDVRGGHGLAVDWGLIARAPLPKVFVLAGGLTPANVARAIAQTNAPIVDVSSGVEARAGVKDASKINAFMKAVQHRPPRKGSSQNG